MSALQLEVVKGHLSIEGSADDTKLRGFLDAAEQSLADRVGPLTATTVVERVDSSASGALVLNHLPILSITSVTGPTSVGATDDLDLVAGIYRPTGVSPGGRYVVTYEAGQAGQPAKLRLALLEFVRHLWSNSQRGASNRRGAGDAGSAPMGGYLIPNAVAALLEHDELDDVQVFDGIALNQEYGNYLMVGVEDPDTESFSSSASSTSDWAHAGGTSRDEEGTITCAALAYNGDADAKKARDDVAAILAGLGEALRDDYTLGIDVVLWTSFGTSLELSQAQEGDGASAMVVFQVAYRARI